MKKVILGMTALAMTTAALAGDVTVVTTDTVPGKTCAIAFNLPVVVQADVKAVSFDDPTLVAAAKSIEMLQQVAARYNANSVLGVAVAFTARTEKDTGKVVVTGTLANCQ